ncbi:zinc-binding dehydrogenase [Xylophilus rhododendri]|uniref:Zinc-binding dehydrogenase n=1 Tax=Xylophilus rhododendri TaxID=2697032 RepID=A0A857J8T3_9BURK|nr:alcohol dehydrogenase [Xylophilus rhododendri]QHJ00375.1 zinc-binding dehydrogenase [Xylophilus rhododendri]
MLRDDMEAGETAEPTLRYAHSWRIEAFGAPLAPHRMPAPEPQGRELLLRTRRCGVCHSDLHLSDGYFDLGGGKRLTMAERDIVPPLTPGHEIVGELIAAGPCADLEGLALGKSYLVCPWIGCGRCGPCRKGRGHLCLVPRAIGIQRIGGYSDRVIVPEGRYLIDIEGLDPSEAATLACAGLTAYSAISKGQGEKDDWLALIGLGGVGSAGLQIARGLGFERIAVVDMDAAKLDRAMAHGAHWAVNTRETDASARLRSGTGGIETVVDFVGSSQTAQLGLDVLLRGGSYIAVGMLGGKLQLPLPLLATRAITVRGSYTGSLAELRELVALAQVGRIEAAPVETMAHARVNEALDKLRKGLASARQVLDYD